MFSLFFFVMSEIIPPIAEGARIPGIEIEPFNNASWVLKVSLLTASAVFAVRVIYDVIVVIDTIADMLVERLGSRRVTPARRIMRDITYMLLIIILAEASVPVFKPIPVVGPYLNLAVSLAALLLLIILAYDIGKTVYRFVERKVDVVSEKIIDFAEKSLRRRSEGTRHGG